MELYRKFIPRINVKRQINNTVQIQLRRGRTTEEGKKRKTKKGGRKGTEEKEVPNQSTAESAHILKGIGINNEVYISKKHG